MLNGIDISNWQGDPDYTKLKKSQDFVIVKASEGNGYVDPKLSRNQYECRKAGITLGYYAFVRPDLGNTPEAEADWFLKCIGTPQKGELFFLDFEVNYSDCVNWCNKWLKHVEDALGVKPLIYLNQSHLTGYDWSPVINGGFGLWLAQYDYNPDGIPVDTEWAVMAFRQYSNKGVVSGISGGVDMNVFYGDEEALAKYGLQGAIDCPTKLAELQEKFDKLVEAVDIQILGYQGKIKNAENKNKALLEDLKKLQDKVKALELELSGEEPLPTTTNIWEVLIDFINNLKKGVNNE